MRTVVKDGYWRIERGKLKKTYFAFFADGKPLWTKYIYRSQRWSAMAKAEDALRQIRVAITKGRP